MEPQTWDWDTSEEEMSRFGHHPNPAMDYEVEIDCLEGMAENRRRSVFAEPTLRRRIQRALDFVVGAVPSCVAARQRLLQLDAEFPR